MSAVQQVKQWALRLYQVDENSKATDIGLLIVRVTVAACLFYHHGAEKFYDFHTLAVRPNLDPIGLGIVPSVVIAGFSDGICSLLVLFGLFSRYAAFCVLVVLNTVWWIIDSGLKRLLGQPVLPARRAGPPNPQAGQMAAQRATETAQPATQPAAQQAAQAGADHAGQMGQHAGHMAQAGADQAGQMGQHGAHAAQQAAQAGADHAGHVAQHVGQAAQAAGDHVGQMAQAAGQHIGQMAQQVGGRMPQIPHSIPNYMNVPLYILGFLIIFIAGPGRYSIDKVLQNRKKKA
jgi:putative oxidoreductase